MRASTLAELAQAHGKTVPDDLPFAPGMGLDAALAKFSFTLSLMQEPQTVARIAAEICEDAVAEGVGTLEIRFAPQLHSGAAADAIVDAALDGIAGRAGLILCGLYGEPPAVLAGHVAIAATRSGVVGIDLAGGPGGADQFRLEDYAGPFERARKLGIGRTVHAGEGRPATEIRTAVELLHATRIGHGVSLLDDPALVNDVIARGVTLEACPTSNMQTGVINAVAEHPLPRWLKRGVRACINTDNTYLSQVDAPEEYRRAGAIPGMTPELLALAMEHGHAAAFTR